MSRFLRYLLCSIALSSCYYTTCYAQEINYGVISEERVINLPNDQAKWYVSVVGNTNDSRYNEILGWFETNEKLVDLKRQVHFIPVTSDTTIYAERYAGNIKALPTIRIQQSDGTVIYEASGKDIPMSPEGLYGAVTESVRPVLPWRRDMEDRLKKRPQPKPGPLPVLPVPDPTPSPIDDGGPPIIDTPAPAKCPAPTAVVVLILSVVLGTVAGLTCAWKKTYRKVS